MIITGASSGIGYATAKTLAKSGAKVAVGARRIDRLEKLQNEINNKLKNGVCKLGNIENDNINENFDIIWMSHCYEHVLKPDMLLKKCKNILTDDGFIFIAVAIPLLLKSLITPKDYVHPLCGSDL